MDVQDDIHTIHHVESLRLKPEHYWPAMQGWNGPQPAVYRGRPALNLGPLISALSVKDDECPEEAESSTNGRVLGKRKRPQAVPGPSKRTRRSDRDEAAPRQKRFELSYPPFLEAKSGPKTEGVKADEDTSFLPVYRFALNLRYDAAPRDSQHYADDRIAEQRGWLEQERQLCSLLKRRQANSSLSQEIDLGRFMMMRYHGRFLAYSPRPSSDLRSMFGIEEDNERWMFLFPNVPWPDGVVNLGEQAMQVSDMHLDFINACAVLQSHGRTKLEANLKLQVLPEGTHNHSSDFPFELRAYCTLSLSMPEIYYPFRGVSSQREISQLENLQRRLICLLSNTPLTRPVDNVEGDGAADVTIPFFLNIMRPAPPLPQAMNYESLQPEGLLSVLMPFQRRTVAWMLEREGKGITPTGTVGSLEDLEPSSSTSNKNLPLFWEEIEMGGRNFFFNRLTSAISPTPPELHTALGGIVAEEPGLGKTMECLSLMLLNPAPERNPSTKRWDPEAQLHVKEIKTTLIVTPPAIAAQWAEELATHAPGLKVFVYEGWTNIKLPVTEVDVEAEREKRRSMAAQKSKVKRKVKAKQNGKSKVDDVVMDDPEADAAPDMNGEAILDWPSYINQFDVCITTYNVLRADIVVARAPPKRPRRQDIEYKILTRPRSPLLVCEWYRVIMDEVQMMGTGKTEEMVSLIPRLSSFAVSGTPARAKASDLIGVLRFLRVDDLVAPSRMWDRLLKHGFKDLFAALFRKYSVRTLKSAVKDELTIPQQQRYLVGIELGRVERHVYDQSLGDALMELGLDARGVAAYEGWEADASVLRNVLRRLRGICTHPQVGQLQKQGDKLNKPGTLKSMADVLEAMKEQNWKNLTEDRRTKVLTLTRLAQLQQHRADDRDRYQRALEYLLTAEAEANQLIDEINASIAQHNVKGETLKKEAQVLRDLRRTQLAEYQRTANKGKGKGRELEHDLDSHDDHDSDVDSDEDVEDRGLPKTPAGEEHRGKRIALLTRLRECLMVLHRVKFLQGDVYHVLGSSQSEKEDAAYADAESLRKDLLKSTEEAANKAMQRLSTAATEKRVTENALQIPLPFMKGGGIRSTHLFEETNEIIEEVLNEQGILLWQWRTKIVELLTQRLNSSGEHADGEEYSRTLDTQGEAEVYMQAYAALLADRREAIAAERTLLAAHEGREKKTRKTKAAARAKLRMMEENLEVPEDVDVQPQHEVLYGQLLEQRKELQMSDRALKSIMVDLAEVSVRIPKDNDPEKVIAKDGVARLRGLMADLQDLTDKLDADLTVLRKVFNDRIVYFRQLQEISDTVAEVQWDGTVVDAMRATQQDHVDLSAKITTTRARQRYLDHLAVDGTHMDEDDTVCVLCQCEFLRGFITQCAHIFCEACLKAWIARGQKICPVCRGPINVGQLERFTMQEDQPPPPKPVLSNGELVPVSNREIQYNMIDPTVFADIQMMESHGSYGSKIQTLVRHLLHIQIVDQGAKSIVFSAWADSLTIIEHALHTNGILCLRLDRNQGRGKKDSGATRFRTDPNLQVLLLHGERDNAGLNFTCASRVFLLESVVNHGFEVQAIARIDRMGQVRATEVFCYFAEDTVEKNILDLAARQGLSLYTKDNSAGSLNVTSFAMDSDKNLVDLPARSGKKGQAPQKGDFIFKVDDMLAILFPHMFEDVEYLLPPDPRDEEAPSSGVNAPTPARPPARRAHVNAEAGPSRLRAS